MFSLYICYLYSKGSLPFRCKNIWQIKCSTKQTGKGAQEDMGYWRQTNINHVHTFSEAGFLTHYTRLPCQVFHGLVMTSTRSELDIFIKRHWLRQGRVLEQKHCRSQRQIFYEVLLMQVVWERNEPLECPPLPWTQTTPCRALLAARWVAEGGYARS